MFVVEGAWESTAWAEEPLVQLAADPRVIQVYADQCQWGLRHLVTHFLFRKPTKFLTVRNTEVETRLPGRPESGLQAKDQEFILGADREFVPR